MERDVLSEIEIQSSVQEAWIAAVADVMLSVIPMAKGRRIRAEEERGKILPNGDLLIYGYILVDGLSPVRVELYVSPPGWRPIIGSTNQSGVN